MHLDWRKALLLTHRWLGIAGCVLFATWFFSGIVMMYARMPELSTADRLARLPAIVPDTVRVAPPLAKDAEITRLLINTIETRPVFRVTSQGKTRSFFADTGDAVPPTDSSQAVRIATQFHHGMFTLRYDERLTDADQWSFGVRGRMPLHRLKAEDPDKTTLYVTENGGEVVLLTTQSGRFWGGAGAVLHWIYFTPFRRLSSAWNEFIVWTSIAGTIMCIVGIAWGLWRLSPLRGYRLRREPHWSPYAGWMRWHHYAGLIFGVVTTTWIFSGLLSMDPFDWHPGTSPTREQRQRVSGGPIVAGELTPERLQRALKAFAPSWPKEIEIVKFRGHYFASAAAGKCLPLPTTEFLGRLNSAMRSSLVVSSLSFGPARTTGASSRR